MQDQYRHTRNEPARLKLGYLGGEGMNPIWLENIIKEMSQDIKDLKEIIKAVSKTSTTNTKKGK